MKKKMSLFPVVNGALLCLLALVCLYPMLYVLFASLSEPDLLMKHRGMLFGPLGFTLQGYVLTFKNPNILSSYANTLFYVGVGTALNVLVTAMAAYALSRKDLMFGRFDPAVPVDIEPGAARFADVGDTGGAGVDVEPDRHAHRV